MSTSLTPRQVWYRGLTDEQRRAHNHQSRVGMAIQRKKAQALLCEYKLTQGCAYCGYSENAYALQMDHIIPLRNSKRHGISTVAQAQKLIDDSNVQVLCANCHAIKTSEEARNINVY